MRTSKNSRQSGSQPPGRDLETTLPGLRTLWSLKMYQKLQKNIVLHNKKTWKIIWYWDYWPQNKYLPEHRTLGNNVPGLEPEKVENHCSWDYKRHKLSENDSVSFTLHSHSHFALLTIFQWSWTPTDELVQVVLSSPFYFYRDQWINLSINDISTV